MANRRLLWTGIAAGAVLTAALVVMLAGYLATGGVQVTVSNGGTTPLQKLVVHVTGRSYSLGDVPPGSSRSVCVNPASESRVEIEFADEQGQQVRLNAGGYFEPGYRGRIDIRVRKGGIEDVQEQARPSVY